MLHEQDDINEDGAECAVCGHRDYRIELILRDDGTFVCFDCATPEEDESCD